MFTRDDLTTLMSAEPRLGVSIYLPTHVRGSEIRQDPIRLKNLTTLARERLHSIGVAPADAEEFLAPATELLGDHPFWQHQSEGLALFLDGDGVAVHKLPFPVEEHVEVGSGFQVRPLLPVLAADGVFDVVTVTAGAVRVFQASRFALVEDEEAGFPKNLEEEIGELDYENPVQASPAARPNTGVVDISNAQVYGDSPAEWAKNRLVDFAHDVARALDARSAKRQVPVVLVADAELGGHVRKACTIGPLLAALVETNPDVLDSAALHDAAYTAVRERLDGERRADLERFRSLLGNGDAKAAAGVEDAVRAAHQGRVDVLFLTAREEVVRGRYDESTDQVTLAGGDDASAGRDLLEDAAVQTLRNGGRLHLLDEEDALDGPLAAVLRY
ncbi:hypothetical protein CLV92_11238 [Kineococcus xinjiangensis]|uniref:ERF1-like protein n=1 Tax=Kineococcus xinjiangensis TaxID=512762 RepID=A0A2S6IF66_9ACTN|nr:hypothetical protein [Kineococcus xinjiangensis]PPK92865.1 hypothetical protein CLV92_11238 [Kineococcus xinjiangensis]